MELLRRILLYIALVFLFVAFVSSVEAITYLPPTHYSFEKNGYYYTEVLQGNRTAFSIDVADAIKWKSCLFGLCSDVTVLAVNRTTFLEKAKETGVVTVVARGKHAGVYVITRGAYYVLNGTYGKNLAVVNGSVYVVEPTGDSIKFQALVLWGLVGITLTPVVLIGSRKKRKF